MSDLSNKYLLYVSFLDTIEIIFPSLERSNRYNTILENLFFTSLSKFNYSLLNTSSFLGRSIILIKKIISENIPNIEIKENIENNILGPVQVHVEASKSNAVNKSVLKKIDIHKIENKSKGLSNNMNVLLSLISYFISGYFGQFTNILISGLITIEPFSSKILKEKDRGVATIDIEKLSNYLITEGDKIGLKLVGSYKLKNRKTLIMSLDNQKKDVFINDNKIELSNYDEKLKYFLINSPHNVIVNAIYKFDGQIEKKIFPNVIQGVQNEKNITTKIEGLSHNDVIDIKKIINLSSTKNDIENKMSKYCMTKFLQYKLSFGPETIGSKIEEEFLDPKNTIADNEHANEHAKNAQFSPIRKLINLK